ncbi:MAG: excinuclease ABC subunit C [Gemmatimonadetes bacterium]|nr:excinuclease ABC subunit C [Gemmatimonadota bacterium]MBT6145566.1 excinuclease ABC subunit C [Gemmatimonadota bacterium]MBT7859135.1 excinuclease ABC subunit C [Gemmatimonadota bacterium]
MKISLSDAIRQKLDTLPNAPGVYLMKDDEGRILYVGKAKNLRSRVRSYFQESGVSERGARIELMVRRVADLDVILTQTEQEALILEATQIKAHKPRYNINLKDDKKYPFIRITSEPYPRIFWTRDIVKDGSRHIGPYSSARQMRMMLDVMHRIFPVRSCRYDLPDPKVKLCMEFQIRRCEGPCEGLVSQEDYRKSVNQAVRFLRGDKTSVIRELRERMAQASKELKFEVAARCRDQIEALETYQHRQKMVLEEQVDRDIIGLARHDDEACCTVLEVREGRLVGDKHHFLGGVIEASDAQIISAFIRQFYLQSDFIPRQILVSTHLTDGDELAAWLTSKNDVKVTVTAFQRGLKARAQELAVSNAAHMLEERRLKREALRDRVPESVHALQRDINSPILPRRIEGIDISNFQGTDTVGSLVVMVDGKPKRSEYRSFKIRSESGHGPDDYASIHEVVTRRISGLQRRSEPLPDLLMIDGGKGQLSSAMDALRQLEVFDLPVVGLAKRLEEIFVPAQSQAILLPRASASLRLLQVLRDEAHRFAITHHRKLRSKRTITSKLDDIPGIGPKRRQALLREFGSVRQLREAEPGQIATVKGFSLKLALQLKEHLQPTGGDTTPESIDAETDVAQADAQDNDRVTDGDAADEQRTEGVTA